MTEALKRLGRVSPPSEAVRFSNNRAVALMSLFLNDYADRIRLGDLEEIASSCGVGREYAYVECVAALCGVGTDSADRAFKERYLRRMIRELVPAPYLDDPYFRTVRLPDSARGPFEFRNMTLPPAEPFVFDDFVLDPEGRLLPQIGYFAEPYRYPAVLENGREWMTLLPNEIATTRPAVSRAHGRVLTYGLGLGYFAFMASEKPEVSGVTVVESSRELIELFRSYLLPQFPHGDKIRLIPDDAFAFAGRLDPSSPYDYVFADIWHDVGDGTDLYLRMKEYEKNLPGADHDYWLEKTILCYLAKELWLH